MTNKLQRDPAGRTCPSCEEQLDEIIPLDINGTCYGCGSCYGKSPEFDRINHGPSDEMDLGTSLDQVTKWLPQRYVLTFADGSKTCPLLPSEISDVDHAAAVSIDPVE